jgi:hypothetical protein
MKVWGTIAKDEYVANGGAFAPLFCVGKRTLNLH